VSEQLLHNPEEHLHAAAAGQLARTLQNTWESHQTTPFTIKHYDETRLLLSKQIDCPDFGEHRLLIAEQRQLYAIGVFATDRRTRKPTHIFDVDPRSVSNMLLDDTLPSVRDLIVLTANIKQSVPDTATRVSTIQDLGKHMLARLHPPLELPHIEPPRTEEPPIRPRRLYIVS